MSSQNGNPEPAPPLAGRERAIFLLCCTIIGAIQLHFFLHRPAPPPPAAPPGAAINVATVDPAGLMHFRVRPGGLEPSQGSAGPGPLGIVIHNESTQPVRVALVAAGGRSVAVEKMAPGEHKTLSVELQLGSYLLREVGSDAFPAAVIEIR